MDILLTSTARRIDFVEYFQEAYKKLGIEGNVITADPDSNAPSLQQGDISYVTPHQAQPEYVDAILSICEKHPIKGIIPINDLEISLLANNRKQLESRGIFLFTSYPDVVDKMRDKGKYEEVLGAFGVKTPRTFTSLESAVRAVDKKEILFPLILKPRNGQASIGVETASSVKELNNAYSRAVENIKGTFLNQAAVEKPENNIIIQEAVKGEKFSVDIFNNLQGEYTASFIRKQLAMRGGDVDQCKTVENNDLTELAEKIGTHLGHIGYINTDVYYNGENYYVIDMNPRIGGGYSFSHEAGADIPAVISAMLTGREINPEWLSQEAEIEYARHDRAVPLYKQTLKKKQLMTT
nr:ATP-grasp domain-containing protein [Alkalicoccus halolimnae]